MHGVEGALVATSPGLATPDIAPRYLVHDSVIAGMRRRRRESNKRPPTQPLQSIDRDSQKLI